jgi:hypothetical protein
MYTRVTNEEILDALMATPTKTAAAEMLGIARSTINERMKDPDLANAYNEWRQECVSQTSSNVHAEAVKVVSVLARIAHDPKVSPSVRVQAANSLLNMSARLREVDEVEERIQQLEELYRG